MTELKHISYQQQRHQQKGAILAATLMIMLVLSLIGITAMETAGLEGIMARNTIDRQLAFQSAEIALRSAGDYVRKRTTRPSATNSCNSPPCVLDSSALTPGWWEAGDDSFWESNGSQVGEAYYIIEERAFVSDSLSVGHNIPTGRDFYSLTARGKIQTSSGEAILQGTFVKRYN